MANVFPFNRTQKENQLFFIGSTQIPGVQSINGSYTNSATPLTFMGASTVKFAQDGPQVGNFNVNYLLISTDRFLTYTGTQGFNGYIVDSVSNLAKNYSFSSGYLTSYSSKCSLGEIPQAAAGIQVFGNLGRFTTTQTADTTTDFAAIPTKTPDSRLFIPGPGSITLNLSDFNTNAVQSYNVNINVPRNPLYILGSNEPYNIQTAYPMEVMVDFTILMNDYSPKKLKDYPLYIQNQNVSITAKDYTTNETIVSYSFNDMSFVAENYNATVTERGTEINLQYKNFYTR